MNRIFFFLLLLASFGLASCDEVFEELPDDLNEEVDTPDELRGVLADAYIELLDGGALGGRATLNAILMGSLINESSIQQNEGEIYNFSVTIFNDDSGNPYTEMYRAIQRANLILERADDLLAPDEAQNLKGQAHFLRGLSYFYLVRLYGHQYGYTPENSHPGVPLVLDPFAEPQPRATVQAVYDQVLRDLQQAEMLLPDQAGGKDTNNGFASAWSAKGLLAKVYLQMNDYPNALAYADDVIENGGFELEPEHIISITVDGNPDPVPATSRYRTEGSSEGVFIIWSEQANNYAGEIQGKFRSDGDNNPPYKLDPLFVQRKQFPGDVRNAWYLDDGGIWELTKYNSYPYLVYPLIHLTELHLIRAEAAGRTNTMLDKAEADLQAILDRAYGEGTFAAPTTPSRIVETALDERQREMVAEGDEFFTFKRLGALGEPVFIRGASWDCDGTLLLMPRAELDNNPLINSNNPREKCN